MTQDEFVALAPRFSFRGGLLLWLVELEIRPEFDGGARVRIKKLVPDRTRESLDLGRLKSAMTAPDGQVNTEVLAGGLAQIGSDYFLTKEQIARSGEQVAFQRIIHFVKDSMMHEVNESIRVDGALVQDDHADDPPSNTIAV